MPQEFNHQQAIRLAVQTEKELMTFYQRAAEMASDAGGKQVFQRLAQDEEEHVSHFFSHYRGQDFGSLEEFLKTPCQPEPPMLKELATLIDSEVKVRRAMEIALRREEQLELSLRNTARQIVDPGVRIVFEQMATETRHHYQIIESEYAHLMGMVHETDIDTYVRE